MSYVGFVPQKVTVASGQSNVTVRLSEDAVLLNEVVVVGYGKQKKVNLTGAVASVGGEELENRVTKSLSSMLQGTVAGLNVTTSSGVPGSSASINVRGITSIHESEPLVLIDGAVGDIDRVNPNDVESISVIKDASAAAIYGARAAFGVILVTTKSGAAKGGKATVRYSGRFGWQAPTLPLIMKQPVTGQYIPSISLASQFGYALCGLYRSGYAGTVEPCERQD